MHYIERVRIPGQVHKYPTQLSGGQQRVAQSARLKQFLCQVVRTD
ncbi:MULTISPECIES: hypothetical protein [unclassified Paraburkholderia]|nr:ABC-type polar amino acid transport system ATPase subunit [Paraburkholderia sp. WSM4177]MBB5488226.1 ABC-type polar amino acid transport system ATPase subunit [Paraburkholderia sp. WSM4180]MDH6152003.1 ABC-type polar amino acid transport system ATPase subunit [Paraburkholderia sp. WSM4179]